jgi:hypothetical protein
MYSRILLLVFILFPTFFSAIAQDKNIVAIKAEAAPKIDGELADAVWNSAPVATDFIQNFPTFGIPATTRTEVKILYDDAAIYIAAYMYDDPSLIRKQFTSRDGEQRQDVDYFSVFFDTYNDQQNGFQFLVTTANVQSDAKIGAEGDARFGNFGDKSWDAVWESRTSMKSDGWIAEIRIPYISLRFAKKDVQTWGLQFTRFTRRNNETSFWHPVDPNMSGFINQFGKYTGLTDIQPPLRLSLSPYVSAGVRITPEGDGKSTDYLGSGGMDIKYGINESFTLDATLIPDFGQVISDNVVNNLTPFEQRFEENRPFFTEGTELFTKAGLFYSRRIGRMPSRYGEVQGRFGGDPNYEIMKNPTTTRLYNAIKLSGRTEKKLGIGVFNAVTAPMEARVRNVNTKMDTVIRTEPLTNYNLFVLDQAFKGRSSVTFTNTNVIREGSARDANASSLDWALFNKKNSHRLHGTLRYSKIFGYTPYSSQYFMNLDTTTINGLRVLNPYDGFTARMGISKVSGKIQYSATVSIESDKYDPNDMGYLQAGNEVNYLAGISYNEFEPRGGVLTYGYGANARYSWLYTPYKFTTLEFGINAYWVFQNFWDVNVEFVGQPIRSNDYFELRTPGYHLKKPAFIYGEIDGSTDSRKKFFFSFGQAAYVGSINDSNTYIKSNLGFRYRFSDYFTLSTDFERQHDHLEVGYAFVRTPANEPIVAYRSNRDISAIISAVYNFSSQMNITLRGRHYWSKVNYQTFYTVDNEGEHVPYSAPMPDLDQNVNIFNIDAFFTWDFRPGSRVIAGWKNWLGSEYEDALSSSEYQHYLSNFKKSLDLPHGNELTLRLIYFLDYNQLRKKK